MDFIDDFVRETERVPSPEIFRLWSALTAVSGVLEQRTWTMGSAGPIYPNLFTILVGAPSTGKTNAIRLIRELWAKVPGLNLSPDNVTKAALIDTLGKSIRTIINGAGAATVFSAMNVCCPEFGVFFTHHDTEFLSVLNYIYDSPATYREERRTAGTTEITRPYLVILGGTQPDYLNSFLPEEAWGMGFASRLIMIYAPLGQIADIFSNATTKTTTLAASLNNIFKLKGEFVWDKLAVEEIRAWNSAGCPPVPQHSKLIHYNGRRILHTVKLAMISAASRQNGGLHVTIEDVERARDWILSAEVTMPDIFRAMAQRSDSQVIADMHYHIYQLWARASLDKRQPVLEREIYKFLSTRVTSERISKLIEVAERTGYLKRGQYPGEWVPQAIGNVGTA